MISGSSRRAERRALVEPVGIALDLTLIDQAALRCVDELDRIFDRQNMAGHGLVQMVEPLQPAWWTCPIRSDR